MKCAVDTSSGRIAVDRDGHETNVPLYSAEGFELLSELWLKVGWNQKHVYTFTWLGRPMIQLPEDMVRIQEVIHRVQPDVIIESGVAHGGALVFYASLCEVLGKGRVVGIDIQIRPHNRKAIEEHPLAGYITLIEGSSTDPGTFEKVRAHVKPDETTIVMLDAAHNRGHVRAELEAYGSLVSRGSYIVVMDGIMELVADVPRGRPEWIDDNPAAAARDFLREHPEFVVEQPEWQFNESELRSDVTHWPRGYLRRIA
jgi:cephalosporin hydroxylase